MVRDNRAQTTLQPLVDATLTEPERVPTDFKPRRRTPPQAADHSLVDVQ